MAHEPRTASAVSHLGLRQLIGWIGVLLPFALLFAGKVNSDIDLQHSISAYYHTAMRDVFVGAMCAVGVFLISYRGYPNSYDNVLTNICGVSAVGVALFPVNGKASELSAWVGYLHYVFAVLFFGFLIAMCFWVFTGSDKRCPPTKEKRIRNRIYVLCGAVMLLAVGCAAIIGVWWKETSAVFWAEFTALLAFGFAWLTKGEVWLTDATNTSSNSGD